MLNGIMGYRDNDNRLCRDYYEDQVLPSIPGIPAWGMGYTGMVGWDV